MAVRLGIPESVAGVPLARRLAWVTAARVALLALALGALGVLFERRGLDVGGRSLQVVVALVAGAFALAGMYAAVLRAGRGLVALAVAQVVLDQMTWTALAYVSGGPASGATSFLGVTCLLGAFLIGARGAAIAGIVGLVTYVALSVALVVGWLPPPADQPPEVYAVTMEEFAYHLLVNVLVLVVVTLLAGYLAERLRSAGGALLMAEERAERAERLAALGRLATGLAHEIRNPLGSIAGSAQLLRSSGGLSDEETALCGIIEREAARLNELVTDMMEVARPRRPELLPVDVSLLSEDVVALARRSGRAVSDVTIEGEVEPGLGIRADGAQLRQMLWNLVRNAVQSARTRVIVRVRARDDGVLLEVTDDGPGIEPGVRGQLFDAFVTTRAHGTGMGLAVVKRIVDDHGFLIEVESEHGAGATFRVALGARIGFDEAAR
ncbi:MAG: two-component sensor histidine kinase, partial [Deltaproteobacteria bacterium]|nr:two-component sensor histidine kinase [Deltaproteobacteria bacterium]